jgi:hypothetical protein
MSVSIGELDIRGLGVADLGPAADLYAADFRRLRAETPELPDGLLVPTPTRTLLRRVFEHGLDDRLMATQETEQ